MYRFFGEIAGNTATVTGEDAHHIENVLRRNIGDEIIVCCGDGLDYICKISAFEKNAVVADITESLPSGGESDVKITVFQGLPKGDKLDTVIQKSVELGAFKIAPLKMHRCVVKIEDKKKDAKVQRWNKIALSAAKQCGRGIIPEVMPPLSLKEAKDLILSHDLVIVAYEEEKDVTLKDILSSCSDTKSIAVIIGPEGGIEKSEHEFIVNELHGKSVTLGNRILRTETAPISIISMIMYHFM